MITVIATGLRRPPPAGRRRVRSARARSPRASPPGAAPRRDRRRRRPGARLPRGARAPADRAPSPTTLRRRPRRRRARSPAARRSASPPPPKRARVVRRRRPRDPELPPPPLVTRRRRGAGRVPSIDDRPTDRGRGLARRARARPRADRAGRRARRPRPRRGDAGRRVEDRPGRARPGRRSTPASTCSARTASRRRPTRSRRRHGGTLAPHRAAPVEQGAARAVELFDVDPVGRRPRPRAAPRPPRRRASPGRGRCRSCSRSTSTDDPAKAGFTPDGVDRGPARARCALPNLRRRRPDDDRPRWSATRRRPADVRRPAAAVGERCARGHPALGAGAVDGHERRLRGRRRGGRDDRPGRPRAVRRAAPRPLKTAGADHRTDDPGRVDSGSGEPERRPLRRPPDPAWDRRSRRRRGRRGAPGPRVARPPVEGAANHALLRLIAGELGVPRGAVHLIAGASGRIKLVDGRRRHARGDRGALARPRASEPVAIAGRSASIMRIPERGPGRLAQSVRAHGSHP